MIRRVWAWVESGVTGLYTFGVLYLAACASFAHYVLHYDR